MADGGAHMLSMPSVITFTRNPQWHTIGLSHPSCVQLVIVIPVSKCNYMIEEKEYNFVQVSQYKKQTAVP